MSPRTGRPTDAPKKNRLEIRLTDKQAQTLTECAKALNTTKTEILIKGVELVKAGLDKKE